MNLHFFTDNPDGYVDCEEDDVVPTNEHFRAENRYKPSLRTPRELPTIREENREDIRSNTSSRVTTRPPSVLSDKSNDLSSQFGFQSGGNISLFVQKVRERCHTVQKIMLTAFT